jgi:hypothetical protein
MAHHHLWVLPLDSPQGKYHQGQVVDYVEDVKCGSIIRFQFGKLGSYLS